MSTYKCGDVVEYMGYKCEVIEQNGSTLIMERLGSDVKASDRAMKVDVSQVRGIKSRAAERELIRRR